MCIRDRHELSQDPYGGKPLLGKLRGYWSYRVSNFRIIYVIREREVLVEVLRVQHRKEVYERLKRI
ncbi:MAG: type II toxin-antitoxin system mRNA interferase toxin, RelE/StbE family [Proteobacteria bacterium]|nr:type II toxin-antitoxin system mRNA interferase toxin, RelE/StbE family [Pseudomonadota bacterium]